MDVVGKIKEIGVKIRFGSKRAFNPHNQKRTSWIDDIKKSKERRKKMKKILGIILMAALVLSLAMPVWAEEVVTEARSGMFDDIVSLGKAIAEKVPAPKQGIGYDFATQEWLSIHSIDVVTWGKGKWGLKEDKLSLGLGIGTDWDDTTCGLGNINYKFGGLEDFGFSYPLQEFVNIEASVFGGKNLNNDEAIREGYHYGVGANLTILY